jgi:DNA-binding MarR family transcriptional regulator
MRRSDEPTDTSLSCYDVSVPATLADDDYRRLLAFRTGLRRYLRWAEERAAEAGITPAQHQLLLAVRGLGPRPPTVGGLAGELLVRHHSVVELVDRAEAAGLVRRRQDPDDHRVVRVALTTKGTRRLQALASQHLAELARMAPTMRPIWEETEPERGWPTFAGTQPGPITDDTDSCGTFAP